MNRWLEKINKSALNLTDKTDTTSIVSSVSDPTDAFWEKNWPSSPAPQQEIDQIIANLTGPEVGRDLGPGLIDLVRRVMSPLDRKTRATLAAEIDDCFEHSGSVEEARQQAALAVRGRAGEPEPKTVSEWLDWIRQRCALLPEDANYIASIIKLMPPARMATACRWYVQAWARAVEAEPKSHRKDNAGRRAANITLMGSRAS